MIDVRSRARSTAKYVAPLCMLLGCFGSYVCAAAESVSRKDARLAAWLDFELEADSFVASAWHATPADSVTIDLSDVHSGRQSVRLTGGAQPTYIGADIPIDFRGDAITLRGFLKLKDVSGFAGLWMRQDGETRGIEFDNMQRQAVAGTRDWAEYTITLPLASEARSVSFGVLLVGTGTVWADALQMYVDGVPIADAPASIAAGVAQGVAPDGPAVSIATVSSKQVRHLALLAKTWGFLKYHHRIVAAGERDWDSELLSVMGSVLKANTDDEIRTILLNWVHGLGPIKECTTCPRSGTNDLHLQPRVEWLTDVRTLGPSLSEALSTIYRNRAQTQFYVSRVPNVGNALFQNEPSYADLKFPNTGLQLLGLFRWWNIVEYWSPYRDLLADWDAVLERAISAIALAKTREEYVLAWFATVAQLEDSHANLWNALELLPPAGTCQVPVGVRFVERLPVLTRVDTSLSAVLAPGDVIESIDGKHVNPLIEEWAPYYPASNERAKLKDIARNLLRGSCDRVRITVNRGKELVQVDLHRVPIDPSFGELFRRDRAGDAFQLLSPRVAYLKLSAISVGQIPDYMKRAEHTDGLIIDIRNYPSEFVVFALGSLLVENRSPFARFTTPDLSNPGAFGWTNPIELPPLPPQYRGKVIVLVDETSISQAEYTAMAFSAAPNAQIIGAVTTGADGNVSPIVLPGNIRTAISGIGVFHPDKRPTQRVGIVPDTIVLPTIEGIREGRDEILEAAVQAIVGSDGASSVVPDHGKQTVL